MSATFTSEFRHEFEIERDRWLQRRVLWYTGILSGWNAFRTILSVFVVAGVFAVDQDRMEAARVAAIADGIFALMFGGAFVYVRKHPLPRDRALRLVGGLILAVGIITLIAGPILAGIAVKVEDASLPAQRAKEIASLGTIFGIFVAHFTASLFIPWTPREAIRPLAPLLIIYAIRALIFSGAPLWVRIIFVCLSPLIAVPGLAVSAWRNSRFRERFGIQMLKGRYGEIKQELASARQIHESLFPKPMLTGPVRFEYRYEPMRQIGGDYLFTKLTPIEGQAHPVLHMAVVDVTGHGIGAALTVNRLYGEIARRFGENSNASPGEILTGLNDYLHHTLATHSVYATAVCLRFDPNACTLEWASAGHPPAFLRTVDGRIDRLDSTTLVLGACRGVDFQPNPQSAKFHPGDMVLVYTDGAIEARNAQGRMLGLRGLESLVASAPPDETGGFASAILRGVDEHRFGPPQDDTLVVEVWRPLRGG